MAETNLLIVVVYPSQGAALTTAAICRLFRQMPEVRIASELEPLPTTNGRRIIVLDYLVAKLNRSMIPEVQDLVIRLTEQQANVIGYQPVRPPAEPSGLANIVRLAVRPKKIRHTYGYDDVVRRIPCSELELDSVGLQLAEDANRVDGSLQDCEPASLANDQLPSFDEKPDAFRMYVEAVIAQGNALAAC